MAGSGVETEIKLKVARPEAARETLRAIGARLERARHFEDNLLLDDPGLTLARAGSILRLRRTDAGGVLTYKGERRVVEGIKSREEVETAVADPDGLQTILAVLGLRPVFRYQKYREIWTWGEVEIVVDETPIGTFMEVEGPLEAIHKAARALGRGPDDYIAESYGALFAASGGTGDMVFR